MKRYSWLWIAVALVPVVLATHCTTGRHDVSPAARDVRSSGRILQRAVPLELGDVSVTKGSTKKETEPIPGRLLVKIEQTQLLDRFRPTSDRGSCELRWLNQHNLLPMGLRPRAVEFLGLVKSGGMVFGLYFDQTISPSQIEEALQNSPLHLAKDLHAYPGGREGSIVVVVLERRGGEPSFSCSRDYYALKPTSPLQHAFRDIGVVSMRRVFRFAEVPDRASPQYFRVTKVEKFLSDARRQFPARAARGYPMMTPAPDLENWFLLRLDGRLDVVKAIIALREQSGIVALSADFPLEIAASPNDPEFSNNNQWGLRNNGSGGGLVGFDINIGPAWDDPTPAAPVVVAAIDTGFKEDLDELRDRLWANPAEIPGDGVDNDCNGYVDDVHGITTYDPWRVIYTGPPCSVSPGTPSKPLGTHGTNVAGIIAASTNNGAGIAGTVGRLDAKLMNITVGWCSPGATLASGSAELAEAMLYALNKGADVANISLVTWAEPVLLSESLRTVLSQGLVVVASAGNDGQRAVGGADSMMVVSPAGGEGVISVGGSQRNGRRWPSSNYGPGLSLVAPAANIRTITFATPTQTVAGVTTVYGTSAAAAFVSGTAAVVLAKYPHVTVPYMRDWLRATARDIINPNGTGANLPGNDEWTGAGMLDAGMATASLANALDQPLSVSILVERNLPCFATPLYDVSSGSPDLGITVKGAALGRWWLEYGEGEPPTTWTVLPGLAPGVTSQPIDVSRTLCPSCAPAPWNFDVAPGHNYLDTDLLRNRSIYTVKLVAENLAGRRFEAYDWFRPVRAMMAFPPDIRARTIEPDTSILGLWGWPSLWGYVDFRPGATYNIRFDHDSGSQVFVLPAHASQEYISCPDRRGASVYTQLLGERAGYMAPDPSSTLATYQDGWYRFWLTVTGPSGGVDSDSLRAYVDNSHFSYREGWPTTARTSFYGLSSGEFQMQALVVDMGGGLGKRLFVHRGQRLVCLDISGTVKWTFDLEPHRLAQWGDGDVATFAVADVDGDGVNEIAVVGIRSESSGTGGFELWNMVYLLKADGTLYNSNWPVRFRVIQSGNFMSGVPAVHIGDVAGNAHKEIIFYEQPINYYGIRDVDIRKGYLHVVNLDGQPFSTAWPKEFSESVAMLRIQVGDLDADGKDELLLQPGQILKGDGSYLAGWGGPETMAGGSARILNIRTASSRPEVLQFQSSRWSMPNYTVTLKSSDGSAVAGWPVQFSASAGYVQMGPNSMSDLFITAGQLIAGGNREIVLCYDRIRALNAGGAPIEGFPEIDVQGRCEGITLADVDADGQLEYVVRVARTRTDMPAGYRRGSFLEAYKLNGTPLSITDSRWPVVLPPGRNTLVADFDQDGGYEVVNVLDKVPYPGGESGFSSTIEVLTIR